MLPHDNARRRNVDCARAARHGRRIIAAFVTLDGALLLVVVAAILLLTFRVKNTILLLFHGIHLATALLGWAVVAHTAYAHDVLRWLKLAALLALFVDTIVALFRLIIITQTDDALQMRTQVSCLLLAVALVFFVDVPLAYYADEVAANACILPLDVRPSLNAPQPMTTTGGKSMFATQSMV